MIKIGISGIGFVGGAMLKSFARFKNIELMVYDKFKNGGIGAFNDLIKTDILFLSLPTLYSEELKEYDKSAIVETLNNLKEKDYQGLIVIKSTVEPTTSENYAKKYGLNIVHNPEFLTARQAFEDFENQNHIVLGNTTSCDNKKFELLVNFYRDNFPKASISICTSTESESMKVFLNSFYATKVQFFTELYLSCCRMGMDYDKVKKLMLKNDWINEMHTNVPGPDKNISYGGMCFPKDTKALLSFMKKNSLPCKILEATVVERDEMRND